MPLSAASTAPWDLVMPHDCHFCRQLNALGKLPHDEIVWQFPHSVAFLGAWQFYHGYCVLVSRRHVTELSALDDDERRSYLDEMCLLSKAIEAAFHPHKMNYELLGNQVPHLHWHLFPRYRDDPARMHSTWVTLQRAEHDEELRQQLETGRTERAAITAALREQLIQLKASLSTRLSRRCVSVHAAAHWPYGRQITSPHCCGR
jgi:diadenosine tetraphosphate (Ap4A) HIT family hydrolase